MQVNAQNIDATLHQVQMMVDLAADKLDAINNVADALTQNKPLPELMSALAGYAVSLAVSAKMELEAMQHNVEELTAIKQHLGSGLVVPVGAMPVSAGPGAGPLISR